MKYRTNAWPSGRQTLGKPAIGQQPDHKRGQTDRSQTP